MNKPSEAEVVLTPQVQLYVRLITVYQAAGMDLATATHEVRETQALARTLTQSELDDIAAAERHVASRIRSTEARLDHSLRKAGRPPWYGGPAAEDFYWPSLRSYLLQVKKWDEETTVTSIDRTSTEVVSLLANPGQTSFRGRGLVVGYVQSGKTANMTAVIAKAIDAGYRFVIILAGLTNALRLQTQNRLQKDLVDRSKYNWRLHTTDEEDGDFKRAPTPWFTVHDEAQLAIVKKNVTPLGHLLTMLRKTPPSILKRLPILIIDDECDQASVNSSEFDMTAINKLIRQILDRIPRGQYVGYTATPFANVLINPYAEENEIDDLYPQDFITALPKPAGYFGAADLFGEDLLDAGAEAEDGMAMIRLVPESETSALRPATKKTKDAFQPSIPPTLETALRYFLLVNACRSLRGQEAEHSSMLVHTTVYTIVHERIADLVRRWRLEVRDKLATGDAGLLAELRDLWEEEATRVPGSRFGQQTADFSDLQPRLAAALERTEVIVENAVSDHRIDYASGPKTYIVVGGSVLARGLTIEGLSVSYFLRSSDQYDTLLQMGRWFGYRGGYEDLPRMWMPTELSAAFRDLSRVELEIRDDIAEYVRRDVDPLEFAVRIREIPGMAVTSASKMFHARRVNISFSNTHTQTTRLRHQHAGTVQRNWAAGSDLVTAITATSPAIARPGGHLYRGVGIEVVRSFLENYRHEANFPMSDLLAYLDGETARADDPVTHWNVGVLESRDGVSTGKSLGPHHNLRGFSRARMAELRDGCADIKSLMSKGDIVFDVDNAPSGSWSQLKTLRTERLGGSTPLLLLYPIDGSSRPRNDDGERAPLDAFDHLLGLGIVMPDRGLRRSFVAVTLKESEDGETEDLEGEVAAATGASQAEP